MAGTETSGTEPSQQFQSRVTRVVHIKEWFRTVQSRTFQSRDSSVPDVSVPGRFSPGRFSPGTFQSQDVSVPDLDDGKFSNHFSNFSYYDHN